MNPVAAAGDAGMRINAPASSHGAVVCTRLRVFDMIERASKKTLPVTKAPAYDNSVISQESPSAIPLTGAQKLGSGQAC
jgi:hypothetical protein